MIKIRTGKISIKCYEDDCNEEFLMCLLCNKAMMKFEGIISEKTEID